MSLEQRIREISERLRAGGNPAQLTENEADVFATHEAISRYGREQYVSGSLEQSETADGDTDRLRENPDFVSAVDKITRTLTGN